MTFTARAHAAWRGRTMHRRAAPALALLQPPLARVARVLAQRFPEIVVSPGMRQAKRFVFDPTDLPFVLFLQLDKHSPTLRAFPRADAPPHDARIAASASTLVGVIAEASDALFDRNVSVTGDSAAVGALRTTISGVGRPLWTTIVAAFGLSGRAAMALARAG